VAKSSFAELSKELDEACASLRGFTLGQSRITERDGAARVRRIRELCDRISSLFKSGKFAQRAVTAIAAARAKAGAGQARLNLLQARRAAARQAV
jgi:hypothetical protein